MFMHDVVYKVACGTKIKSIDLFFKLCKMFLSLTLLLIISTCF